MADRILVFVPAYNCAPQIGRVLAQLAAVPSGTFTEVLVLDNGSRDGTAEAAIEAARSVTTCPVTVARNRDNYSLGGSHKSAFAHAVRQGYTHVVVLHGDDQGSIADLLPVIERGDHRRYDACLGARFARGSRLEGYSRFRIFGNHVFNALFTGVSFRRVLDLGSGLNIFARSVFADPGIARYADDLRFNVYLLLGLIDGGRKFMFFPISWRESDQVSNVKMVSQSLRTLKILREYALGRRAFREGEHRDIPRESYEFEVLGTNAA
ncbi:glycosyltransferase family 2 protein [Muricoccus aerilatus]|uniref:glycosyltransferase family 2 protein n=1 Tax=Muricoccus aerilatus TaxID=452982 RepID=UPI0005C25CE7|nr:glycosyltransferase family 2 protein [Roseomonas aerilata]